MRFLYTLSVALYTAAIHVAALFLPKARLWVRGRRGWRQQLPAQQERWIWFHCASLGEFEQGRQLLEWYREHCPEYRILLTFFSPSGYEVRKNYAHADRVMYLPADLPGNVRAFLDAFRPEKAFFIKYEIWVNYLLEMQARNLPVYLVSARVRPGSAYVRGPLRGLYRRAFGAFRDIFAQDAYTQNALAVALKRPVHLTGDTRYDRVLAIRDRFEPLPAVEAWIGGRFCLVAGSTWEPDENVLVEVLGRLGADAENLCLILAPHEVDEAHIRAVLGRMGGRAVLHSRLKQAVPGAQILIMDNIGMLSRLYHYARISWVGGGFGKGIHNTLEAAVYGCPVFFGPRYTGYVEAEELVQKGGAFPVNTADEALYELRKLIRDPHRLGLLRQHNRDFCDTRAGATQAILQALGDLPATSA